MWRVLSNLTLPSQDITARPLGGTAPCEEEVLPVPTDLWDQQGRSERMQTRCTEPLPISWRIVTHVPRTCGARRGGLNACRRGAWNRTPSPWYRNLDRKILNRSRVSAKLRHGSSSVGQLKRDRRRTSDRFMGLNKLTMGQVLGLACL